MQAQIESNNLVAEVGGCMKQESEMNSCDFQRLLAFGSGIQHMLATTVRLTFRWWCLPF